MSRSRSRRSPRSEDCCLFILMIEDASPRCRMETGCQQNGVAPYARAGANFRHGGSHPSVPRDPPGASPQRVRSSWRARLLRLEKSHFVKQISVLVHLYRMPCALISKASATFKHQRASRGPRVLARERARWPAWRRLLAPRGAGVPHSLPRSPHLFVSTGRKRHPDPPFALPLHSACI